MEPAQANDFVDLPGDYGVFRPSPIGFRPDQILRVHRYRKLDAVRPAIRKAAEQIARLAETLVSPEVHYRRLGALSLVDGILTLENGVTFRNEAFHRHLEGAREVVVTIATMGRALDDEVIGMMDRFEPLEALFLETCGWLGVEQTAKQFGDFLRGLVHRNGLRVCCRMAPGYSYRIDDREVSWPLEDQRQIFNAFSGIDLPVRLLESCAMLPKMSRSGIYGLAPVN